MSVASNENQPSYERLASGEIRVLEIAHLRAISQADNGITVYIPNVRLRTVNLDDELEFYAISYMWGDPTSRRHIFIDGELITVTTNLRKALHDITLQMNLVESNENARYPLEATVPVWADALCINQADNDEKSAQVARMGEIYTKAARVLVFADQISIDAELDGSMQILRHLTEISESTRYRALLASTNRAQIPYSSSILNEYRDIMEPLLTRSSQSFDGLLQFFQRKGRWWERAWIMQEVALANPDCMLLLAGPYCLEWEALARASNWQLKEGRVFGYQGRRLLTGSMPMEQRQAIDKVITSINILGSFMSRTFEQERVTLADRLYWVRLMNADPPKATVAHDVVYSLLSTSIDEKSCGIIPDYNKSPREVFRDVAVYMFRVRQAFALQCCWYTENNTEFPHSWIANWHQISSRAPYQFWPEKRSLAMYNASYDPTAWWYRIDGYELHLRGAYAGRISSIAFLSETSRRSDGSDIAQLDVARHWLEQFNGFLANQPRDALERPKQAWRLPIADTTIAELGERAGEDLKVGYDELCDHTIDLDEVSEIARTYAATLNVMIKGGFQWETGREVFATSTGFLALGPPNVTFGDLVYVIAGADVPLILRSAGDGRYRIIGETFVEGIMDGELAAVRPPVDEITII